MLPTDQPVPWDSLNAKILKDFLSSPTGERAVAAVLFDMPPFDAGPDTHATLVSSCLREGFQRAVNSLISLATHQPEQPENQPSVTYPDIDDDTKWKDDEAHGVVGMVGDNTKPQPTN